jgi:hypothetical protein
VLKPLAFWSKAMTVSNPESSPQQVVSYVGRGRLAGLACFALGIGFASVLLGCGFYVGNRMSQSVRASNWQSHVPTEILNATATHGSSTLAVCTASIDEETDGFFALDYLTGDLKGWVFNPRTGAFGGLFLTNVSQYLGPPGKNAEYLLVSGRISPAAAGSSTRAASMVLYVVDVRGGQFAAFSVPWDRSMRNSGATQSSVFLPVGGDTIRSPAGPGVGGRKPPAGNPPKANDPNGAADNANPPKANPPKANPPKANPPKDNPPKDNQDKNNP